MKKKYKKLSEIESKIENYKPQIHILTDQKNAQDITIIVQVIFYEIDVDSSLS